MRLFYIDEFGNGDLSAASLKAHPWSVLCAISVADTTRLSLANHMIKLKDRFFPGWNNSDWHRSEIKGRYLRRTLKQLTAGKAVTTPPGYSGMTLNAVNALTKEIGLTFHKFRPTIYAVAVNKVEITKRHGVKAHDPVAFGYVYLQQRASMLIHDVHGSDEGVLLVADEQRGHERLFSDGTVERVRRALAATVVRQADFRLIFDKPLWVNKGELPADREIIQLADVATYLISRAVQMGDWTDPWLREWILPNVARHWGTGDYWNAGITIIPAPAAYPAL